MYIFYDCVACVCDKEQHAHLWSAREYQTRWVIPAFCSSPRQHWTSKAGRWNTFNRFTVCLGLALDLRNRILIYAKISWSLWQTPLLLLRPTPRHICHIRNLCNSCLRCFIWICTQHPSRHLQYIRGALLWSPMNISCEDKLKSME